MALGYTSNLQLAYGDKGDAAGSWATQVLKNNVDNIELAVGSMATTDPTGSIAGLFIGAYVVDNVNWELYHCSATGTATEATWEKKFPSLSGVNVYEAPQRAAFATQTFATTLSMDFSRANDFTTSATGSFTLANPTNIVAGQRGSIVVTHSVGSNTLEAVGSFWKFPGGTLPTLTTTASSVDRIDWHTTASNVIHAVANLNMS